MLGLSRGGRPESPGLPLAPALLSRLYSLCRLRGCVGGACAGGLRLNVFAADD